jgi:hypothetical protein
MKSWLQIIFLIVALPCLGQGICGRITWVSGNQMPGPDKEIESPKGIKRVVYVYEATPSDKAVLENSLYKEIKTKLVATGKSNEAGYFKIKLKPGEYSVFVKEAEGWFANIFDDRGRIQTVTVNPSKFTKIDIEVNYLAAY